MIWFVNNPKNKHFFVTHVISLLDKLKMQGYKPEDLRRLSLRFFKDRGELLGKFNIANGNDFLKEIFNNTTE